LAPAYFEAVTMGTLRLMPKIETADPQRFRTAISATVQSGEFRAFTGPGANSREKLESRIATVKDALAGII